MAKFKEYQIPLVHGIKIDVTSKYKNRTNGELSVYGHYGKSLGDIAEALKMAHDLGWKSNGQMTTTGYYDSIDDIYFDLYKEE